MGDGLHVDASPVPCNHETGDTVPVRGAAVRNPHDPSSRTDQEAEHDNEAPFQI